MSVSADEFLILGRRLLEGENEIDFRSAVSRGYYSIYHVAQETANRLALPCGVRRDVGAHEQLIARFETKGPGLKKIARRLRDKKRTRCVADYQLGEVVTKDEARLFVAEVERLAQEIDAIGRGRQELAE
ncbi:MULTISPECIES: hypothetical protein [Pseudomonas]|uniref:HEPN domain-containing protein n=1 Tax=Pseudomonas rhodesiae TaxID=76760 RepID=A0A8I1JFW3_9PSED|nr:MULTISPECIES: hypothetical protein [Pseudomonas]MBI6605161.1 hypothetical protein [Pseudomonas sp. S4_EA_1b]MBI6628173.1 hypothetical protein [Pseudomonas rhodesiae]